MGNGNKFLKHTKENNFTIIDNDIFKDTNISLKAKGLLATMLSLSNNWEFSESGLSKLTTDGLTTIKNTLKELEDNNYLKRIPIRNNKGQYIGIEYNIYEVKQTLINQQSEPMLEKPISVEPMLVNTHNKETTNKELNNKYIYMGELKNVKLTTDEYEKLIDRLGENKTLEMIERLSLYMGSKGKQYKSHYATILNWTRKDDEPIKNKSGRTKVKRFENIENMYD